MTPLLSDYFLEILDRSGAVNQRVSLAKDSVIIGRAYDCQVIVDDPYVCPQHVRVTLDESGRLLLEDLDSVNGLSLTRHGAKQAHLQLQAGDDCYIGNTKLKFRCRNDAVASTRRDHSHQFVFNVLQQPRFITLLVIIPFIQLFYVGWLDQALEVEVHSLLITPASVYVFLVIWAFVWAIAGKLLVHRAMFLTHLAIISAMTSITTIVEGVTSYGVFVFDMDVSQRYIEYATGFIITAALIYMHLHFSSRGKPKRLLVTSILSGVVMIAASGYIELESNSQFSSSPRYNASLKPPAFVFGSLQSTDEFLSDMEDIESAVEQLKISEK